MFVEIRLNVTGKGGAFANAIKNVTISFSRSDLFDGTDGSTERRARRSL